MAITKKRSIGNLGEKAAAKFLIKNKYKIIQVNYSNKHGEIDIICTDKDYIVFVEVKLKNSADFGLPREKITASKLKKIKIKRNK